MVIKSGAKDRGSSPTVREGSARIMETESSQPRFAVCINNAAYPDDLKVRTIYQVLPDESAARSNYVRVVDETGEDYLYPAELLVMIDVPIEVQKALIQTPKHS